MYCGFFKNATEMFSLLTKAVPHAFYALVYAVSNMYFFQKVGPFKIQHSLKF